MESLTSQIRTLYTQSDDPTRQKIQSDLRDLQLSFDTEWDTVVRLGAGLVQITLVKTGTDLNLFQILASHPTPLTLNSIAEKTNAAPNLLTHILRATSAFGLTLQTSPTTYTATSLTHTLASPHVSSAIKHVFDVHAPVAHAFPGWLADHKYQDIRSNKDLPFHRAMDTHLEPFEWMKRNPEQMVSLGHAMAIQRVAHWTSSYPIGEEVGSYVASADSALLVDVGGGFGQQAVAFQQAVSSANITGRIVVQDVPETLESVPQVDGIEFEAHDFFTEQPIKGAKFYYLRHILHDWTDEDSVRILKAIVPAMGPESRLVIDEVVLPEENLPWQAAYMDITMMGALGGVERTKAEYESLLDAAGLKLIDMHKYDAKLQSVMLAALK
ncbi:S-adenosyl-L-methionine-dependent methyltransferase [Lentithecium fluviatile CBS 122367]|uniref:S-adenosyl-L-methionine-dependent methyltransferase n=1 Tax=Lentithecium fluviatile CBS 122367 TaxID=1168545 RepID=A0A6G1IK23_9PLEO|nr:S-adenosyl-L-methionine-dependent methyltransferase [Lentithecium fluviatile CBS 122367]